MMIKLPNVLLLTVATSIGVISCGKSDNQTGIFVNPDKAEIHMELKSDGTFTVKDHKGTHEGKYVIDGITFTIANNDKEKIIKGTIKGNTITVEDGSKWVKK